MNTFSLEEHILDKWPQGQMLPDGFLKGSERKTLQGIAIMLDRMEITPDLEQAVRNLLDKGDLIGHIDDFMTVRKNDVDRMIQSITQSFTITSKNHNHVRNDRRMNEDRIMNNDLQETLDSLKHITVQRGAEWTIKDIQPEHIEVVVHSDKRKNPISAPATYTLRKESDTHYASEDQSIHFCLVWAEMGHMWVLNKM